MYNIEEILKHYEDIRKDISIGAPFVIALIVELLSAMGMAIWLAIQDASREQGEIALWAFLFAILLTIFFGAANRAKKFKSAFLLCPYCHIQIAYYHVPIVIASKCCYQCGRQIVEPIQDGP